MKKSRGLCSIYFSVLLLIAFTIVYFRLNIISTVEAATTVPETLLTKKTLYVGNGSYTIKFKNLASNAKVTYKSSSNKVATVSTKGLLKPIAKGSATITITIKQNSKSYTSKIAVTVKTRSATPTPAPTVTPKPLPTVTPKPLPTVTPAPILMITPTPGVLDKSAVIYNPIFHTGFENGTSGFLGRGSGVVVNTTENSAKSGKYSLQVSKRTKTWNGAILDMTGILEAGKTYQVTAWVKHTSTSPSLKIQCTIERNKGENYLTFGSVIAVKDIWTKLTGSILIPADTSSVGFYFESSESATDDIYIDDIELSELLANTNYIESVPSISEAYKEYFFIGASMSKRTLYAIPTNTIILHQFNTITTESEMKPESLLDYKTSISDLKKYNESPAIYTEKIDEYLKYAKVNGIKARFHTLLWHNQTPRWLFTQDYSTAANAPLVSKEIMLKRMENYIRQIMECAKKYPGVIYAWDVVNEAIEPNHNKPNGYRSEDSLWYQIIGEEYVEKAFEYARKYSYDDAGLFYNDYNTYILSRRTAIYNLAKKLKDKGLIDGIGMQTHIDMTFPSLIDYEATIRKFAELDLEINITEMDIHNNQNTVAAQEALATRYGDIFKILLKLKKEKIANITSVTFWGVIDSQTWLTNHRGETSYPLLFDKDSLPKPSFYALINLVK